MQQHVRISTRRFPVLLMATLIIGIAAPIFETLLEGRGALLVESAISISLCVALLAVGATKRVFWVAITLLTINLASSASWLLTESMVASRTANAAGFAFVVALALATMRAIFQPGPVTVNKLIGALCVYLLIGVGWAELYHLIYSFDPLSFNGIGDAAGHELSWRLNYFSFVTLTTLGYGDILPVTTFAQSATVIETLIGQLYLAVLVAALVSSYLAEKRP